MSSKTIQDTKNLKTKIAVKKLEIKSLQKEMARREREAQEELWRRYES